MSKKSKAIENHRKASRNWRAQHKGSVSVYNAAYYATHKEFLKAMRRKWYEEHREEILESKRMKYREQKLSELASEIAAVKTSEALDELEA
jgi:hypothetical protein